MKMPVRSKTTDPGCLVCRKHAGEIAIPGGAIFENELIFISHAPLWGEEKEHYLGHLFVETKRHVAELADLTDEEFRDDRLVHEPGC